MKADLNKSPGWVRAWVEGRASAWPASAPPGTPPNNPRKQTPIYSGVLAYFPAALAEVARCSFAGNEQHNPGTPLHWDRAKSGDELDALMRHLRDHADGIVFDDDGITHLTKVAWRALAALQKQQEASDAKQAAEST